MNIVCFGLSHQTAEVDVRERFAFADKELPAATRRLAALDGVHEALILSTCNRVEHYAVVDPGADPARRAEDLFRRYCETEGRVGPGADQIFHHDAPRSVEHLFRVACGLESMVIGETEILGQVKRAYLVAAGAGTTSRWLNPLFPARVPGGQAGAFAHEHRARGGVGGLGGGRPGGTSFRRPDALQGADPRRGRDRRTHGA